MKKLIFVPLAVALLIPVSVLAQDTAKPDAVTQAGLKSPPASTKTVTLSGKVGEDGKTLTTRKNSLWTVANPELMKDHAGQQVKVKCQISPDPDTNKIHVLSVKVTPGEMKYVANRGDAAFRR